LAVIVQLCVVPEAYAQKRPTLLEFFFPSLREKPKDPSDTLEAPFADEVRNVPQPALDIPFEEEQEESWDKPHRLPTQIGAWVMKASAEALTFESDDYQTDLQKTEPYFNSNGRKEYMAFLESSKILKVLQSGQYRVRGVAQDAPQVLNEGAVGGFYRWVFRLPIMVSYMGVNMSGYEREDATTQYIELIAQAVRMPDAGEEGVKIEIWNAKVLDVKPARP